MKLIFENWRKHINEQEEKTLQQKEEQFFGSDIVAIAIDLLDEMRKVHDPMFYGNEVAHTVSKIHNKDIIMLGSGNTGIGEDGRFLLIDSSISNRITGAS
jgi:hypothetical protein